MLNAGRRFVDRHQLWVRLGLRERLGGRIFLRNGDGRRLGRTVPDAIAGRLLGTLSRLRLGRCGVLARQVWRRGDIMK